MAEAKKPNTEEAPAEGGGKKKIILLAVIGVVLIALSVGGTVVALKMMGGDKPAAEAEHADEEEHAEPVKKVATYYPLKPTLIVNFIVNGKQRFLQAEVTLMIRDDAVAAAVEEHNTAIQHSLLMLFSAQDFTEVQTPEGKELLRQQALAEVQKILQQEIGKPGVEQVLFTSLVMQ